MSAARPSPAEMRVVLEQARAELGSPGVAIGEHGPRAVPAPGVIREGHR